MNQNYPENNYIRHVCIKYETMTIKKKEGANQAVQKLVQSFMYVCIFTWTWIIFHTILVLSESPWRKKKAQETWSSIFISEKRAMLALNIHLVSRPVPVWHMKTLRAWTLCLYLVRRCRRAALCSLCSLCFTLILPYCAANSEFHTFSLVATSLFVFLRRSLSVSTPKTRGNVLNPPLRTFLIQH